MGADGSVRMFDIRYVARKSKKSYIFLIFEFVRSLDHSTIIYESPENTPLLRLAWNRQDDHYLAAISVDSPKAIILDTRFVFVHII